MAVLEAVRGWEYHAGLPHIGVEEDAAAKEEGTDEGGEGDEEKAEEAKQEEVLEEGMWSKEDVEGTKLDGLLRTDYVGLLLEHDEYTTASARDSLRKWRLCFLRSRSRVCSLANADVAVFDISSYIPDPLLPKYQSLKESVVSYLEMLGIVRGAVEGGATGTIPHSSPSDLI